MTQSPKSRIATLFIGPVRKSDSNYIRELIRCGCEVVALCPNIKPAAKIRGVKKLVRVDFHDRKVVCDRATKLHARYHFATVVVIYEFHIEIAAAVRRALKIKGMRPEVARIVRDKFFMSNVLSKAGISFPATVKYPCKSPTKRLGPPEWLLKPRLAAANLGVRTIRKESELRPTYRNALKSVRNSTHLLMAGGDLGRLWILSEFVTGSEFEAHLVVHSGQLVFKCVMQKFATKIGDYIYETRMIMPADVSKRMEKVIDDFLLRVVAAIRTHVANPSGEDSFVCYPEFIVRRRKVICLEIAYRCGGTATAVELGTGVNLHRIAAQIHAKKLNTVRKTRDRAVCMQIMYSTSPGKIEALPKLTKSNTFKYHWVKHPNAYIKDPPSEYVGFLYTTGSTAKQAALRMDVAVSKILIKVGGQEIPQSKFLKFKTRML